jgi:hypothetical protein
MDFASELLCEVVQEVQPLLQMHWEELTRNKEIAKLAPMWEEYAALEQMGRFVVFTARDDGKLVGYNAFFINKHIHYAGMTLAQNDVFFLVPDHRRGTAALRFLRYCEDQLRELGAMKLTYHCKTVNNFAPILHRLGFADEELIVGKVL